MDRKLGLIYELVGCMELVLRGGQLGKEQPKGKHRGRVCRTHLEEQQMQVEQGFP